MKKTMRVIVALILCFALCISQVGCVSSYLLSRLQGEPSPTPAATAAPLAQAQTEQKHGNTRFSDMAYVRPDLDALEKELKTLLDDVESGKGDADALMTRYQTLLDDYNDASGQSNLAYLLYTIDITDDHYKDEYDEISLKLTELDLAMTDVSVALLEREDTSGKAQDAWGQDFIDNVHKGALLNSVEVQELFEEEQDLTFRYDELSNAFRLADNGREWAFSDLAPAYYAGEITYSEYFRLYDAYCKEFNQQAGKIYQDLLKIRAEIAKRLGFSNYAAYAYASYDRDYTLEDAQTLHAAIKQYLVPIYVNAATTHDEIYELSDLSFGLDSFMEKLKTATADFSPMVAESLNYMLDYGLYDFDVSAQKLASSSFTTYLASYRSPFIFTQWEGSARDIRTVTHEFGHFTNYYLSPCFGWSVGDSLDLAEVDSQGLELLMQHYYESFYKKNADAARVDALIDAMYAVISGCMEDEFQQKVYENPNMTLDEMNALYLTLAHEYGIGALYGYTGVEWTLIPHSFQSPMYYISYATSMVMALELWSKAETDRDAAVASYLEILTRPAYAKFRTIAEESGLADPMSADAIRSITAALKKALG